MNENNPLKPYAVPKPGVDLRHRVLSAARAAKPTGGEPQSLWTRLAEHRGLQLAWVATLVVLVGVHIGISLPSEPKELAQRKEEATKLAEDDLKSELELARIHPSTRSARSFLSSEEISKEQSNNRAPGGTS